MNTAIAAIESLMGDPAPGLVFGVHERAKLPRRAHPSRHAWGSEVTTAERKELIALTAGSPELADLLDVYERSNGVHLFYLKCPNCDEPHWGLTLLPISEWATATAVWQAGGDCASLMEGCDLYHKGQWRVIASMPSEEMHLVQFFSGEHDGEKLAGKIYCIGLDGYLGFQEEVAPNLSSLMQDIAQDPAAFFDRLGFGWTVEVDEGCFGDPIEQYIADVRGHPDAVQWPPTRPK
ncbi:MAG: hypothetical protein IT434_01050 [Phycisphaerales bacterium]|jgi:hypothetical protein|nr:hypothetical protein [Phycisphaerales bacterium]